jgi:hypothetical protein
MKGSNLKDISLTNYSLVNYSLVFAYVLIITFTERDSGFRNIASNVILILMVSHLAIKILSELSNRDENSLKNISNIIIRGLLIFAILLAFYFFS